VVNIQVAFYYNILKVYNDEHDSKYKTCALQEMDPRRRDNSTSITGVIFRHEYLKL